MHAQKNRRADQWLFCFAVALSTVFAPALARGTPSPNDGIWTELVPTAVSSTCAIVDPVRHRLVFFGGDSEGATSRSVWALSLEGTPVWTVLTPVGPGPEARYGHSAIYDPVRDRMIIFGGYSHGTETYHDDVWALSLSGPSTWTQIQPSGALPASAPAGSTRRHDNGRNTAGSHRANHKGRRPSGATSSRASTAQLCLQRSADFATSLNGVGRALREGFARIGG